MSEPIELQTSRGLVILRPEKPDDAVFLFGLFRSHALPGLVPRHADDAAVETLVNLQFRAQTVSYRTQYPNARFDIIERDNVPVGRLIVDDNEQEARIVDFALLPESRGSGIGTAVMSSVLTLLGVRPRAVHCMVLLNNEASMRMCLRASFREIGDAFPFKRLKWTPPGG